MTARTTNPHCDAHAHRPKCRPARPLCRWMRAVKQNQNRCYCEAYAYPHRKGSGLCNPERLWAEILEADQARERRERLGLDGRSLPPPDLAGVPF